MLTQETSAPNIAVSDEEPQATKVKTYACFCWPTLSIGARVKFSSCFFITADPTLQAIVERATGFLTQIHDVSADVEKLAAMPEGAKLYLCFDNPGLEIERRLTFHNGRFFTEDKNLQGVVERFADFGTAVHELPRKIVLDAAAAREKAASPLVSSTSKRDVSEESARVED